MTTVNECSGGVKVSEAPKQRLSLWPRDSSSLANVGTLSSPTDTNSGSLHTGMQVLLFCRYSVKPGLASGVSLSASGCGNQDIY